MSGSGLYSSSNYQTHPESVHDNIGAMDYEARLGQAHPAVTNDMDESPATPLDNSSPPTFDVQTVYTQAPAVNDGGSIDPALPPAFPHQCVWCFAWNGQPHRSDCLIANGEFSDLTNNRFRGVQTYGNSQGPLATPTPVRNINMHAFAEANFAPAQVPQTMMCPLAQVPMNTIPYYQPVPRPAMPTMRTQTAPRLAQTPQDMMRPTQSVRLTAMPNTQVVPAPMPTSPYMPKPTTPSLDDKVSYLSHFPSFEAAHAFLQPPADADPIVELGLENDDFTTVKQNLHDYASRLLDALQLKATSLPETIVGDFHKAYYFDHQSSTLNSIRDELKAHPLKGEARVLLCLQEIISLHETGLPESILYRTSYKQGYRPEADFICSERVEKVIHAAATDKYVAHDILSGHNILDLVRSPEKYLSRKRDNSRVNATKAFDKKTLDESRARADGRKPPVPRQERRKQHGKMKEGMKAKGVRNTAQMPLPATPESMGGVQDEMIE